MTTDPTDEAGAYRIEHDSMGEVRVPRDAKWRATTQRAVENFPISGQGLEPAHIAALGAIKAAAAQVNGELGILEADVAEAIRGRRRGGGGGRAGRPVPDRRVPDRLGHQQQHERQRGDRHPGHGAPGTGRSIPTTTSTPASRATTSSRPASTWPPRPAWSTTSSRRWSTWPQALEAKRDEFAGVVKSGRTHLMDATPVTLGQEFGGYAAQVRAGIERLPGRPAAAGGAAAGRHRGRHRHQHAARLRRADDRGAGGAHRPAADRGARPLRGAGRPGRAGRDIGPAANRRGQPLQDRQRPALDGLRPARRAARRSTSPTCSRARRSCRAR